MSGDQTGTAGSFVAFNMGRLHRYAQGKLAQYRVPSGRLQADDVVNHTMAEVLERWEDIHQPQRYMYVVARRFVLQAAHDAGRFTHDPTTVDQPADFDQLAPDEMTWTSNRTLPPVEDQACGKVVADELRAAMDVLTDQQRRAVELVDMSRRSRTDSAAAMGVTPGAVSAHRARALKRLRTRVIHLQDALYGLVVLLIVVTGLTWHWLVRRSEPGSGFVSIGPDWFTSPSSGWIIPVDVDQAMVFGLLTAAGLLLATPAAWRALRNSARDR
ncbi:sigma-70 family RNA polymerase sigma factor [Actinoplanes sp. CA-051413]|uniref:sigma-70 family RNA polymerase sigma factor n=1 Tax=Actinoplanes sp. CA-051413 TaxID=3239899 RepID=UPI003D9951D7